MLWQRIITALILIPLVLFGLIYAETKWVALITGIIIAIGAREWANLANLNRTYQYVLYVLVICGCLTVTYWFLDEQLIMKVIYAAAFWWLVMAVLIYNTERSRKLPQLSRAGKLISGVFTLVPAWLSLVVIHSEGTGETRILLIFLFLLIWMADISAYFCGKKWGNHKIAPVISPGKTWEGALGAFVGCGILSIGFSINKQFQLTESLIFLVICQCTVVISIIGDFMESLLKRSANVKDSGTLLPGHGGVLDRIDSLTAASPVFLTAISLAGFI